VYLKITLSIDDEIVREARRRAEIMGTSANQLICDYLERLAGKAGLEAAGAEFERLSRGATGNSHGWKFNRDEVHDRR
jgi:hypothetical protein